MAPASSTRCAEPPQQQQPPRRLVCRLVWEDATAGDGGDAGVADAPLLESRPPPAATPCYESDAAYMCCMTCGHTAVIVFGAFAFYVLCIMHH